MRLALSLAFSALALAACSPDPSEPASPATQETDAAQTADAGAGTSAALSCEDEIGRAEADVLVEQCLMVSTATRPPCNVANSCEMIREEIARGCGFGDQSDNPDFCDDF